MIVPTRHMEVSHNTASVNDVFVDEALATSNEAASAAGVGGSPQQLLPSEAAAVGAAAVERPLATAVDLPEDTVSRSRER